MHLLGLSIACAGLLVSSDWLRFRGPNGTGISPDASLPDELSRDRNVAWKVNTPNGNSSPVVVNRCGEGQVGRL